MIELVIKAYNYLKTKISLHKWKAKKFLQK